MVWTKIQKVSVLKWYFVFVVFLFPSSKELSAYINVEKTLSKISYEEKYYLKAFFREFFLHDSMGHVLFFGTKPACLTGFTIKGRHQHFFEKQFAKGWICWKKYESCFPHPNFLFVEEEVNFDDGDKVLQIFFINKTSLKACLSRYEATFREILGESFCPEIFLSQIEGQKKLRDLIKQDECLLGLILGFGLESSCTYKNFDMLHKSSGQLPPESLYATGPNISEPTRCLIFPIGFQGNPRSNEVQDLGKIYEQELANLWIFYKSKRNTLKLILDRLCNYPKV